MAKDEQARHQQNVTRRSFLTTGGAVIAGGTLTLSGCGTTKAPDVQSEAVEAAVTEAAAEAGAGVKVARHRTLGRTGFEVSDISLGAAPVSEANVYRYAYDHGINYFDTAESYGNGQSETALGEAMQFMDRKKIFITTKLGIAEEDTVDTLCDRFGKCLERMQTDHADVLMMHGIADLRHLEYQSYYDAVARLKADGKLRFAGISSHGPRGDEPDSMDKVLCAAAEDNRFDVMLLSYNFMNREEAERVLAACKEKNIGTTAMKMTPATLDIVEWDPDNPAEMYADYIERSKERGQTEEESIQRILDYVGRQQEALAEVQPFLDTHGIKTQEQLTATSLQWVLKNPDMHTLCVSMPTFEDIDRCLPLSGTELSLNGHRFLDAYAQAHNRLYCRHGCTACAGACPENVPVSTIMRYSYYFKRQGREKFALGKYRKLDGRDGSVCMDCTASCQGACPHGIDIQANLVSAHSLLYFA